MQLFGMDFLQFNVRHFLVPIKSIKVNPGNGRGAFPVELHYVLYQIYEISFNIDQQRFSYQDYDSYMSVSVKL